MATSEDLTAVQVMEIRERVAAGETQVAVAKEFSVSAKVISDIVHRKSWQHI